MYKTGYGHVINMSIEHNGKIIATDPTLLIDTSNLRSWVEKHKNTLQTVNSNTPRL